MAQPTSVARWYRSFYWRIGVTFAVFVIVVVLAQSAISMFVSSAPSGRSPNNLAAIVAVDVGYLLAQRPDIDLNDHLRSEYADGPNQPIYVVLKSGAIATNTPIPLAPNVRASIDELLQGADFTRKPPMMGGPPIVTAPIQVERELRGMVVLPPPSNANPLAFQLQRLTSVPGTAVIIIATLLVAPLVFGAARRRLGALERAAQRLGEGDLKARAPEEGADEIAHLAATFNRMADELAARDEALRTSDRLRRQMLADVSHELRTPLTTMLGFLDTLHMSNVALDDETRARYLATIRRETQRLERLVRDLLDLARLENGVVTLDVRLFAICRVFDHIVERHAQDAKARNITMRVSVRDEVDQVLADPDRIEQVVENLVANALRHTPAGGTVEMAARPAPGAVEVVVSDSGGGIPGEHVPHIFDRFYKTDTARTGGAGSGLGLSISKAIVERHGGTIDVTSQPGRTVFRVRLPGQVPASLDVGELVANAPGR